jgi:hypothetical protein
MLTTGGVSAPGTDWNGIFGFAPIHPAMTFAGIRRIRVLYLATASL